MSGQDDSRRAAPAGGGGSRSRWACNYRIDCQVGGMLFSVRFGVISATAAEGKFTDGLVVQYPCWCSPPKRPHSEWCLAATQFLNSTMPSRLTLQPYITTASEPPRALAFLFLRPTITSPWIFCQTKIATSRNGNFHCFRRALFPQNKCWYVITTIYAQLNKYSNIHRALRQAKRTIKGSVAEGGGHGGSAVWVHDVGSA